MWWQRDLGWVLLHHLPAVWFWTCKNFSEPQFSQRQNGIISLPPRTVTRSKWEDSWHKVVVSISSHFPLTKNQAFTFLPTQLSHFIHSFSYLKFLKIQRSKRKWMQHAVLPSRMTINILMHIIPIFLCVHIYMWM